MCAGVATRKCSLKIAAPSYFYMQRDITHNFSGVLEKCLWGSLFLFLVMLQGNKLLLYWKDIVLQLFFKFFMSIFSNFLGVPVFWHTLLNGYFQCVANAQAMKVVWKFVLRKAVYCFVFWGNPFCTTFYFDVLKPGIAPLMVKIILNILFLFLLNFH